MSWQTEDRRPDCEFGPGPGPRHKAPRQVVHRNRFLPASDRACRLHKRLEALGHTDGCLDIVVVTILDQENNSAYNEKNLFLWCELGQSYGPTDP